MLLRARLKEKINGLDELNVVPTLSVEWIDINYSENKQLF